MTIRAVNCAGMSQESSIVDLSKLYFMVTAVIDYRLQLYISRLFYDHKT